ncbi:MAG: tyrosine-type recombinase/integrase [Sporichthyaceae bacterium]
MAARKDRGRQPNGGGSIYQRASDNKWVGATYVLTTDGTRRRKVVYGATWEEAHAKLLAIQDRDRRGLPAPHDAPTVAEYLDYWLEQIVHVARRPATYAKYESMVRVHVVPHLGEKRLDRLTVADCQRFANGRLAAGTSVTTVHTAVATLAAALNRAMREEIITRNVAALVTLPMAPPTVRPLWNQDQLRHFLDVSKHDPLHPALVLMAYYGLRRGEVLGLRWTDIDTDAGIIRIGNQLQRIRGELIQGPPKSHAGRRTLPLLEPVAVVLEQQRERQFLDRDVAGLFWTDSGLVLTTSTGNPIEPRNVNRSFSRLCREAKLPELSPHDMRHMCATLLKDLGVPARDAMSILGHSRITMTLEIYTASGDAAHRTALDRVSEALNRPPRLPPEPPGMSR